MGGYLFSFLWGVSVGVILEHIGETLVDILVDGSRGFSGVLESLTRAPCSHHSSTGAPGRSASRVAATILLTTVNEGGGGDRLGCTQ